MLGTDLSAQTTIRAEDCQSVLRTSRILLQYLYHSSLSPRTVHFLIMLRHLVEPYTWDAPDPSPHANSSSRANASSDTHSNDPYIILVL